jgi:hypothetical protein
MAYVRRSRRMGAAPSGPRRHSGGQRASISLYGGRAAPSGRMGGAPSGPRRRSGSQGGPQKPLEENGCMGALALPRQFRCSVIG